MTEILALSPAPEAAAVADLARGLALPQPELPAKYFYDERGSRLFEEITRLPEYYLSRAERGLLAGPGAGWIARAAPGTLLELGAGAAEKTRLLLDAMLRGGGAGVYLPVDVSEGFLHDAAARLRRRYPRLAVVPLACDFTEPFAIPAEAPRPAMHAFLGSTIGNFAPAAAARLLRDAAARMAPGDGFLLGVDLRKDPRVIEAAYNDAAGVTAAFNLNILRVLNRRAGTDFRPEAWEHRAFYAAEQHRIEMHLVARHRQTVHAPEGGPWHFGAGESIRTEISCKHDRESATAMLQGAGLRVTRWADDGRFALVLAERDGG